MYILGLRACVLLAVSTVALYDRGDPRNFDVAKTDASSRPARVLAAASYVAKAAAAVAPARDHLALAELTVMDWHAGADSRA